jgi:hypothetical protein
MGYRLELRRFEYPAAVKQGNAMPIKMWWVNSGVAPVYRPYILALSFHSAAKNVEVQLPSDLRKWLPGDAVVEESIPLPAMLAGECRIRVALLDPHTHQPAIQLGIEGRTKDGWYDLGPITIQP